jgi:hypothetical protein
MVSLSPHVLGRIELRRVCGEVVDVEPRMSVKERADLAPPMNATTIPE